MTIPPLTVQLSIWKSRSFSYGVSYLEHFGMRLHHCGSGNGKPNNHPGLWLLNSTELLDALMSINTFSKAVFCSDRYVNLWICHCTELWTLETVGLLECFIIFRNSGQETLKVQFHWVLWNFSLLVSSCSVELLMFLLSRLLKAVTCSYQGHEFKFNITS